MDKSNSDISSYEKINLEDNEDLNSNMPIREISNKDSKYFHDENFKDNSFSNYEKDNNTSKNIKINKTNNNKTNSNSNITRNSNNAPTVVVHEVSEIRNNTLNITMSSNVEGTIYYTRNGSTPTKNSRVYTNGQVLKIYVKTQIKAIVITKTGITSTPIKYQSAQIITPPVSVVVPTTDLVNNRQNITFKSNWNNVTIYYTTDGSNPKKNNNRIKYTKPFYITRDNTLNYYTVDNLEGYTSTVYTYKTPRYTGQRPVLTVYNTTKLYSNNHQQIMIQSNQPTIIEYYSYKGKNNAVHRKYISEIDTTNDTQLIITGKHKITREMASSIEYTPTKGTRPITNYTYTISIPYQNGYVFINDTNYVVLKDAAYSFSKNGGILYNNRTKSLKYTNNTAMSEPGILLYTSHNQKTLNIKYCGYVYANLNQVSIIATSQLMSNISYEMFNKNKTYMSVYFNIMSNGKLDGLTCVILENIKFSLINTTPYNTSFTSNFLNYTIDKKDYLNHIHTSNYTIPFQTVQSYVLTNRIITKSDITNWLNRSTKYGKNYLNYTCYGSYLTALTAVYMNDEMCKYYGGYNNVTFTRGKDTQTLIGVDSYGTTYSNIYDPTLAIVITNHPTINESIQFRFMTTSMLSEWERQSIRLSGQNVTEPLYQFYKDLGIKNNTVIFTIDNSTGLLTITPTSNASYYIVIDLKTGITKVMTNTTENELIKGAISNPGQGYCYHRDRSNTLTDLLGKFMNFTKSDLGNEITSDIEDIAGQTLITAGVCLIATGGGAPIGATFILLGMFSCFNSVGGDFSNLFNPYVWADATPSIVLGLIPGGTEIKEINLARRASVVLGSKIAITIGLEKVLPNDVANVMIDKKINKVASDQLKSYLRYMKVPGE